MKSEATLVVEGDLDRVVFEVLCRENLLPRLNILPKKGKQGGTSQQVAQVAALVRSGFQGDHLLVARDLNSHPDSRSALKAFASELRKELDSQVSIPDGSCGLVVPEHGMRIGFVAQGEPDSPMLKARGVTQFAMDDYLLMLLEHPKSWPGKFPDDDKQRIFRKLDEVRKLMDSQGFVTDSSKRLVFIVKAIADLRASDAAVAEQALKQTDRAVLAEVLAPLIERTKQAISFVESA